MEDRHIFRRALLKQSTNIDLDIYEIDWNLESSKALAVLCPSSFYRTMRGWLLTLSLLLAAGSTNAASCRCKPDQPCWPTEANWAALNSSIQGNLVAVKPLAYPCHDANFDEAECNIVKDNAYNSSYRSLQPGSAPWSLDLISYENNVLM